jgi:hypothetical protein
VCEILKIVDVIESAVDALGDFWDSTTDVDKAWWNPANWFRVSTKLSINRFLLYIILITS